jgi:hypothetical protein
MLPTRDTLLRTEKKPFRRPVNAHRIPFVEHHVEAKLIIRFITRFFNLIDGFTWDGMGGA